MILDQFNEFLETYATKHDFLFILGDLFEYWIGDDANQFHLVTQALKKLNAKIFFIPGNRDFLIGSDFLVRTNMTLLKDPTLILLGNKRTLVLHGDTLCTDDKEYQEFRLKVRTDKWKNEFLNKTIDHRLEVCKELRKKSKEAQINKSDILMDVNENATEKLFEEFDFPPLMIHGHTHRPKKHEYIFENHVCERWVLNDWYDSGSFLVWKNNNLYEQTL